MHLFSSLVSSCMHMMCGLVSYRLLCPSPRVANTMTFTATKHEIPCTTANVTVRKMAEENACIEDDRVHS